MDIIKIIKKVFDDVGIPLDEKYLKNLNDEYSNEEKYILPLGYFDINGNCCDIYVEILLYSYDFKINVLLSVNEGKKNLYKEYGEFDKTDTKLQDELRFVFKDTLNNREYIYMKNYFKDYMKTPIEDEEKIIEQIKKDLKTFLPNYQIERISYVNKRNGWVDLYFGRQTLGNWVLEYHSEGASYYWSDKDKYKKLFKEWINKQTWRFQVKNIILFEGDKQSAVFRIRLH